MRPFAVAGLQLHVADDHDNVEHIGQQVDRLMKNFPWVQMVLLSELAPCGHGLHLAEEPGGRVETALQAMAARHGVWFVPGSIYQVVDGQFYNVCPVIDPAGDIIARYRKQFPFAPYEAAISAGTEPLVFEVPKVGRFGVSICYDLWFPETARMLVAEGAEVILHPSLTDTIDRDVELAIVRATAAQNQCYVLDVNGVGDGGNGHSVFVGPTGEILHLAKTTPEEIPYEIDLDRVTRSREVGLRGLGQVLKSFRDRQHQFPVYEPGYRSPHLDALGPLAKPVRGSKAGIFGGRKKHKEQP